ncbi:carbohydrate ABC transporter permease [Dactylosporangium sp. CA-233914]|uniref:carbohydrate ABC transporter permease n=1 Tax=Dactylosporangium sp. CA-233914 TaxID=3239934 RepID=UPI003D8DB53A
MTTASTHTQVQPRGRTGRRRTNRRRLRQRIWAHRGHYLFLLPTLVLFCLFTAWPMIASWYYAFFNWDGISAATDFVGWDNFVDVVTNPRFWNAFKNSLIFSVVAIFVQLPLALVMAMLLNNPRLRGRTLYRLLLFVPVVTTTAIVGIVWGIILDPNGGVASEALGTIGIGPVDFLSSEHLALPTLLAIDVWKGFGISLIYWLAALQTIPAEIYEAARIDGARGWRTLVHITLPLLVPIGTVIVLLTFQGSMNPFDLVQATTRAGPNFSTDVVGTYIYRYAFEPGSSAEAAVPRYGYACAAGIVFGVFTLLITLVQAPWLRRLYGRGTHS